MTDLLLLCIAVWVVSFLSAITADPFGRRYARSVGGMALSCVTAIVVLAVQ